jgi:hypothetical protein
MGLTPSPDGFPHHLFYEQLRTATPDSFCLPEKPEKINTFSCKNKALSCAISSFNKGKEKKENCVRIQRVKIN